MVKRPFRYLKAAIFSNFPAFLDIFMQSHSSSSPAQYCQQKAFTVGNCSYYSMQVAPATHRAALITLHAFFKEIHDIVYECQDFGIARLKFEWWKNEIQQTFQSNAQHPVTQALSELIQRYGLVEAYFIDYIDGYASNLTQNHYENFQQVEHYCKHTGGIASLLCTQVLGYQQESTLQYAERLGIALQLMDFIFNLRRDLLKGLVYIPQDELRQFKVTEEQLFEQQYSDELIALLAYQATRVRTILHNTFKMLSKEDRPRQLASIVRARLGLETLKEIEKEGYRLFSHRTRLTPLRKLWLSWLTRWQANAGKMPC